MVLTESLLEKVLFGSRKIKLVKIYQRCSKILTLSFLNQIKDCSIFLLQKCIFLQIIRLLNKVCGCDCI